MDSISRATTLTAASREALSDIVGLVGLTSDQGRAIATASHQQSAASEEIIRATGFRDAEHAARTPRRPQCDECPRRKSGAPPQP